MLSYVVKLGLKIISWPFFASLIEQSLHNEFLLTLFILSSIKYFLKSFWPWNLLFRSDSGCILIPRFFLTQITIIAFWWPKNSKVFLLICYSPAECQECPCIWHTVHANKTVYTNGNISVCCPEASDDSWTL